VARKVGGTLEIKPTGHRTEVGTGVLAGGQGVGRVETVGTVELLVDGVEELVYAFLLGCLVAGVFFFLFFGEEERLPPREPLSLESAEPSGAFLARFWLGFFFDFEFC